MSGILARCDMSFFRCYQQKLTVPPQARVSGQIYTGVVFQRYRIGYEKDMH